MEQSYLDLQVVNIHVTEAVSSYGVLNLGHSRDILLVMNAQLDFSWIVGTGNAYTCLNGSKSNLV